MLLEDHSGPGRTLEQKCVTEMKDLASKFLKLEQVGKNSFVGTSDTAKVCIAASSHCRFLVWKLDGKHLYAWRVLVVQILAKNVLSEESYKNELQEGDGEVTVFLKAKDRIVGRIRKRM